jgi:hypothetical protein
MMIVDGRRFTVHDVVSPFDQQSVPFHYGASRRVVVSDARYPQAVQQ